MLPDPSLEHVLDHLHVAMKLTEAQNSLLARLIRMAVLEAEGHIPPETGPTNRDSELFWAGILLRMSAKGLYDGTRN